MNWTSELWRRIKFLFGRQRMEDDLAEEMRLHMELRAAEKMERGATSADAQSAARRQFGNATHLRETSRDVWGWRWLDSLAQDVRYGARTLASHPGFTVTAVLSLVLGIGANTAIFSIVNAVMLRSLPVEDPERLAEIRISEGNSFTNPIWEQVRDHQQGFSSALAYGNTAFDLSAGGERHEAKGVWVSGDYFRTLGVAPLRGRLLTREDDRHGCGPAGPVAVISHRFWHSQFGGADGVLGKTVSLNRHRFEIVGITPQWFKGLEVDSGFDVAVPIGCQTAMGFDTNWLEQRSTWWLSVVGRLAPGVTAQQAESRMKAIAPEVFRATVPTYWNAAGQAEFKRNTFTVKPAATGFSNTRGSYKTALFTLMAVVGLVLLIACANIANLLLARASARQREISVRMAIGAGRHRVIRQLLTESLMLAIAGGAGGLLIARWASGLLVHLLSTTRQPLEFDVTPDLRVFAFTAGIAVLTGVLFGLVPAIRATGIAPGNFLKENARGSIMGSSRFRLGKALVAGQVALSLLLLIGAGLFLGSLVNLLRVDIGFDPHGVMMVHANMLGKMEKAQRSDLYQRVLERIRQVHGVESAASAALTPVSHMGWNEGVQAEGYQPKTKFDALVYFNRVSPDYLRTMRTPLIMGRDFNDHDTLASQHVVIISELAARKFFDGNNPIGRTISLGRPDDPVARDSYEVIGVSKDVKYLSVREEQRMTAYVTAMQDKDPWPRISYVIRSDERADALAAELRAAVAAVDPNITVEFGSLERQLAESTLQERVVAMLSGFFGGLALLLAMIGLYGVTAYAAARRQGEIGIRVALGASQASVVWLILRDVLLILAVGSAAGVAASLALGKLVASLLFGVKAADPWTIAAAVAMLGCATAIAGYVPARHASRLDPTTALREE